MVITPHERHQVRVRGSGSSRRLSFIRAQDRRSAERDDADAAGSLDEQRLARGTSGPNPGCCRHRFGPRRPLPSVVLALLLPFAIVPSVSPVYGSLEACPRGPAVGR